MRKINEDKLIEEYEEKGFEAMMKLIKKQLADEGFYKKLFDLGYHKAMHDYNVVHGKDAERFLKHMKEMEEKGPSEKQKKFLEECREMFNNTQKL